MKKTLVVFVATVSFFSQISISHAYSEGRDGYRVRNPLASLVQKKLNQRLRSAIHKRYRNYFTNIVRETKDRNRNVQLARHKESKIDRNINNRSTSVVRSGELKTVPWYDVLRPVSLGAYERRNSKQTFRARAIDYYVEGGYAGTESMKSGVIYGSDHEVQNFPVRLEKDKVGAIVTSVRDAQRDLVPWSRLTASYPKQLYRRGTSRRNFMHPYMGD